MGHDDSGEVAGGKPPKILGFGQCSFKIQVTDQGLVCKEIDFGRGVPVPDPLQEIASLLRDGYSLGKRDLSPAAFEDIRTWLATAYVDAVLDHYRSLRN